MLILATGLTLNTANLVNPTLIAYTLLAVSLLIAMAIFNTTLTSWLPFVTILTFSSGIITMFFYTTSFSPNENTNTNNSLLFIFVAILVSINEPLTHTNTTNQTINTFSSLSALLAISLVLLVTILAISNHGHHPQQTVSNSF